VHAVCNVGRPALGLILVIWGGWEAVVRRLHSWARLTHCTSAAAISKAVAYACITPPSEFRN
jgi:hypothetical protein